VLARPVDVHAASDAAPFLVRCLCAALRTSHGLSLSSLRPSFGVHAVCSRFQDGSRCLRPGMGSDFEGPEKTASSDYWPLRSRTGLRGTVCFRLRTQSVIRL
jgi:hypothetical protein